jgi:uncharacterized protein (DUF885 family)
MTIVRQVWRNVVMELRREVFRGVVAALVVILVCASAQASPHDDLAKLLRDHDESQLALFPSNALPRNDRRHLGRYEESLSAAHLAKARRSNADLRARLAAIERAALGEQDRLSYDIFAWTLATRAADLGPGHGEMAQMLPLDQYNGAHLSFAREIDWRARYPYMTVGDYERAMSRMHGFARWIDMAITRMREGMAKRIVLPRIMVERVVTQLDGFLAVASEDSVFMGPAKNVPSLIRAPDRTRIAAEWRTTVREAVLPAYRRLRDFLKGEYLGHARTSVGLSALPDGRAVYLDDVRARTTLDLSPDAIRAIGEREIVRITAAFETLKNEAGFSGTLAEFRAHMRNDPRFKFRNPAEMLAAFERARRIVAARLSTQFGRIPKARLEFRFYEPFLAPSKSAAEYSAASTDGRRPGIVYVNASNLAQRPRYTVDALELHEGLPGHHLQAAIAMENRALPWFRRYGGPSAFTEGWAQYAESLGPALGLYADPFQKFGALAFDAWRSARLVVDTGIHWRSWSADEAVRYFLRTTMLPEAEARTEVERYIAVPAQALAYKLGELKFFEIRRRAERALGAKFDIRRFHDALLADGAMPLPMLEAKMERWIAAEKAR